MGIKLISSFLVIAMIIAGVAALGYLNMQQLQGAMQDVYDNHLLSLKYAGDIQGNVQSLRGNIYKFELLPENRAQIEQAIQQNIQAINEGVRSFEQTELSPEEATGISLFKTHWASHQQLIAAALDLARQGDANGFHDSIADGGTIAIAWQAIDKDLEKLSAADINLAQVDNNNAKRSFQTASLVFGIASVAGIVLAVLLGLFLTHSITGPLARTVAMIQAIEMGRLGDRLKMQRNDEIGVLARRMDQLADDLQNVVIAAMQRIAAGDLSIALEPKDTQDEIRPALAQTVLALRGLVAEANKLAKAAGQGKLLVRGNAERFQGGYREVVQGMNNTLDLMVPPIQMIVEAANNLNAASSEILSATTQQASGASEQSAAVSQTTSTVEEVKAITEQAILRSQEVSDAAQRTVTTSQSGQQAVLETIESMNHIKSQVEGIAENILALSEQTQQIGQIIATVSEIASQSNMLALNASVEAARAGEHGKGFAVVAAEVRSLAEQSRQATQQVKAILSEIQKATNLTVMATEEGNKVVEQGVRRANQARQAIMQLAEVINAAAQAAIQLSAGGQQQRTGIEQISSAMQNINQATLQGLASTRQAERSAQDLNELSHKMTDTVRVFQLN
jgi:methyl-accepting chemotaxis protein